MAEFIFGNKLGKRAQGNRLLRRLLWRADYAVIWCLVALFRLLPIDAASWLGERLGRWIGPTLKRHTALYRENLATALPTWTSRRWTNWWSMPGAGRDGCWGNTPT